MRSQTEKLGELSSDVASTLKQLSDSQFPQRLWQMDPSLWKHEAAHQHIIRNSLGWLTVPGSMEQHLGDLSQFASHVHDGGFTHALLLGMGGSSLCVEVLRRSFGIMPSHPEMLVLDSTDPATVRNFEHWIDLNRTLFVMASKSGNTVEVSSFYKYFFEKIRSQRSGDAGKQFIAITDPGTALGPVTLVL